MSTVDMALNWVIMVLPMALGLAVGVLLNELRKRKMVSETTIRITLALIIWTGFVIAAAPFIRYAGGEILAFNLENTVPLGWTFYIFYLAFKYWEREKKARKKEAS